MCINAGRAAKLGYFLSFLPGGAQTRTPSIVHFAKRITMKFLFRKNGADGGCSACTNAAGVAAIPPAMTGTKLVLPGGLAGWVAMRADLSFTDVTDPDEWNTKIDDGTLLVRLNGCRVKGDKPDSTVVDRTRGACALPEVVKRSQVWTLEDVGNDDDFTMHDLYEYFRTNYSCYKWGFITCDYRIYGFVAPNTGTPLAGHLMSAPTLFTDDNVPQTNEDDALIKLVVTTQEPGLIKPMTLTFLPTLTGLIN